MTERMSTLKAELGFSRVDVLALAADKLGLQRRATGHAELRAVRKLGLALGALHTHPLPCAYSL